MAHQLVPSFPFFRYSFLCCSFSMALLQPTLRCDRCVPLAAFRLPMPYTALGGAKWQNPPFKTHPSLPWSQQSPSFVHVLQPLCHSITLSPVFIHHCPISHHVQIPWCPLAVCWSHSYTVTSRSPPVPCPAPRPPSQGLGTLVGPGPLNMLTLPFIGLDSLLHELPQLIRVSCS